MSRYLVDTCILVDHLRGRPEATRWLAERLTAHDSLACSVITVAEIAAGLRPGEEDSVRRLFALLSTLPASEDIAWIAGNYMREYARSHGLLLPDALLAASAQAAGIPLVTLNAKHFPMDDIGVLKPY